MFYFNTLNLIQISGGNQVKQGDFGSTFAYNLADEKSRELDIFDKKTAYVNLVLNNNIVFTTTTIVDGSKVTFNIDKAIPTGLYFLEIKVDSYIFPSDRQTIISVTAGSVAYDLKDLVQNYDTNMTISEILSDLSQKGIDISDLRSRLDEVQLETTAQLAQTNNRMKDISINILDYGAKSIEEFPEYDNTQAIKDALSTGKNIFVPQGTFLVTEPIILNGDVVIEGVRNRSKIVKNNTITHVFKSFDINSLFIINGPRITIKDINLIGTNGTVNGVTFFNNSFFLSFENVRFQDCNKPFDDLKSVWMTHFDSIHLTNCNVGFDFTSSQEKTSLFFNNCWVENCGSGYEFRSTHYSSLNACGADRVRYNREDNPYGNGGFGNKGTYKGVYDFYICRGITLNSIGLEHCYGNGAVRSVGSLITVNGANIFDLQSEFVPNYNNNPNLAVGAIVLDDDYSLLNLNNIYVNGFTNTSIPNGKNKSLFAYNYNEQVYGKIDDIIVHIINMRGPGIKISGSGSHTKNVLDYSELKRIVRVYDYIDMGSKRIYAPINLTNSSGGNTVTIPITAQGNENVPHRLSIRGYSSTYNTISPNTFDCDISFSSLTSVSNIAIRSKSAGLSITNVGNTVKLSLPNAYTNITLEIEAISNNIGLIDIDNITLA